jgi:nicotinamidase/pyrazinamidase
MERRKPMTLQEGDALIVVDVQVDFVPGGNLAAPEGEEVVPVINRYIRAFHDKGLPIFATRDWHPANHCSFQAQGGPWPPHCIQETEGAQFAAGLQLPEEAIIISKATRPDADAYSGFDHTELHERLQALGVRRLFIGGLATDYCVRATVIDARSLGYEAVLLEDAVRAIDAQPGDEQQAKQEMLEAGAKRIAAADLADIG